MSQFVTLSLLLILIAAPFSHATMQSNCVNTYVPQAAALCDPSRDRSITSGDGGVGTVDQVNTLEISVADYQRDFAPCDAAYKLCHTQCAREHEAVTKRIDVSTDPAERERLMSLESEIYKAADECDGPIKDDYVAFGTKFKLAQQQRDAARIQRKAASSIENATPWVQGLGDGLFSH